MTQHADELARGERFAFGANWARFLGALNRERIAAARESLERMLGPGGLKNGKRFLDIGSGSGLFSLAARLAGAAVHSFDYDPQSVRCTEELKRRYFPEDASWTISQGSVLDKGYLSGLGRFDVVYVWGVLHHTGALWKAMENVAPLVNPGGLLFLAIYNDQGRASLRWKRIKKIYCTAPKLLRGLILCAAFVWLWGPTLLLEFFRGRPFAYWRNYCASSRGMSPWTNLIDWVGGYPFEVAKPEEVFDFYRARGFRLERLKTCGGGLACNWFVFTNLG